MFDIVSDLHIDQWDNTIGVKYPCGEVKHIPYIPITPQNEILIVAGDISDNLQNSLKYLNDISQYYQKILFVDGNHEHVNAYPNLYSQKEINEEIKKLDNNKIVYLPSNPYQIGKTLVIGACGWWDYNNSDEESINSSMEYFKKWIPEFGQKENQKFIDNVTQRSREECQQLQEILEFTNKDDFIENIVIVTHCVPKNEFASKNHEKTIVNNGFEKLLNNKELSKKISHWIFGHVHHNISNKSNNVKFICHPRGRPEDYNREMYDFFSSKL